MLANWSFGEVMWTMLIFFFWVMVFTVFIRVFADIFHRNDLGGWAKAGWILLIFVLPFLGALIYLIARPKMTAQDQQEMEQYQEMQRRISGYSAADEIAKLTQLHNSGQISDAEYEELKRRAMVSV